jgi:alkylation response protein AidB-like acyl-CoA dehydrogenase
VDLQPTEEQTLLAETVDELLAREPAERAWPALVEFGALEDGLGAVELALVARAVGVRLAAVPFAETAAARYSLVGVPEGAAALALAEPGRRFAPADPATSFEGGRLTGDKAGVAYAATADSLVVPAASPDGVVLAVVPRAAATAVEPEATLDPAVGPALVRFEDVEAAEAVSDAARVVERLAAVAGILVSAETVGAADAVLRLARDYAAERRQFGRTIGSFQAIRHLLADLYVKTESSWSSVLYAAASLDEDAPDALRTASIAKSYAARATHEVAHGALQVFGGIAFTAEHDAHRFLRRIVVRGGHFGTAAEHERSLGRGLALEMEVYA